MRTAILSAAAALGLAAAAGAHGHSHHQMVGDAPTESPRWAPVDGLAGQIRDVAGLKTLALEFPESGSVRLRLLNAQLGEGDAAGMLETLHWLRDRGYVFGEVARGQIPKLIGEEFADRAKELLLDPAEPIEGSTVAWTLPAEAGLVESVVVDEARGRALATSVSGRAVWELTPVGDWQPHYLAGADNLSGVASDSVAEQIWVASGNIDGSERTDALFSGLIVAGPGEDSPRISAPEGVSLSDIHISGQGYIFASDPLSGGVYVAGPDRAALTALVPPGTLRSPQGLASSEDGQRLYVADYRYGIAVVDPASGHVSRLQSDVPVILDGTDALFRWGNCLIAIQNGTSPMRISRFDLSEDGLKVVGHTVLEQAHPDWTEPLSGYLGANALYYIGNGQWDRWVKGEPAQDKPSLPVQIRKLPLVD